MGVAMRKLRRKVKARPHLVLSVPAVLCFITFVSNLITALRDGFIDSNEMHQLLATADGFETVLLVVLMVVLERKKK